MPNTIRRLRAITAVLMMSIPAAGDARTFASQRCHCTFNVPNGWRVVLNPKAGLHSLRRSLQHALEPCAFGLRPRRWPDFDGRTDDRDFGDYAITIYVTRQRFQEAARNAFFEQIGALRKEWDAPSLEAGKKPTDWILFGRQSARHEAVWIKSDTWFGLQGKAAVGYYGKGGSGYRGMDDAFRAVLSTGRWRTAIIMADNPFTETEFDKVVKSFTFE